MPDDEETTELDTEGLDPNIRKALRTLEKKAHDAEVRAGVAERDAAFIKAGVPDTPIGQLFAKSYEGPYEPAAVKEAFDALGVSASPASEPQEQPELVPDQELETQRRMAQATATAPDDGSVRLEDAIAAIPPGPNAVAQVMDLIAAAPPSAVDFAGRRITTPIID